MKQIIIPIISTALLLLSCSGGDDKACVDTVTASCNAPVKKTCVVPTSCVPSDGALVEVLCPVAGSEFVSGDTMEVYWRANVDEFTGFRPQISLDGGTSFSELSDKSVWNGVSPSAQCFSYKVVIPKDGSYITSGSSNANVLVRVRDYSASQATMRDDSELFTILKSN